MSGTYLLCGDYNLSNLVIRTVSNESRRFMGRNTHFEGTIEEGVASKPSEYPQVDPANVLTTSVEIIDFRMRQLLFSVIKE